MFETAQGVTLKANNREATFTLSEDHLFALNLNNKLMPAPKPAPKPNAEHAGGKTWSSHPRVLRA